MSVMQRSIRILARGRERVCEGGGDSLSDFEQFCLMCLKKVNKNVLIY